MLDEESSGLSWRPRRYCHQDYLEESQEGVLPTATPTARIITCYAGSNVIAADLGRETLRRTIGSEHYDVTEKLVESHDNTLDTCSEGFICVLSVTSVDWCESRNHDELLGYRSTGSTRVTPCRSLVHVLLQSVRSLTSMLCCALGNSSFGQGLGIYGA